MLQGKKTYIAGVAMLILGVIDITFYDIPKYEGGEMVMLALGLMGLRHGMSPGS